MQKTFLTDDMRQAVAEKEVLYGIKQHCQQHTANAGDNVGEDDHQS
ncbi:MAG: hypothetical protein ACR5LG_13550 [Sodalis sp. (in: enterobacteria)]